jgi:hypothetical protein
MANDQKHLLVIARLIAGASVAVMPRQGKP